MMRAMKAARESGGSAGVRSFALCLAHGGVRRGGEGCRLAGDLPGRDRAQRVGLRSRVGGIRTKPTATRPRPRPPRPTTDRAPAGAAPAGDAPAASGASYDKDAVEIELKRAARQVKANCGSATDDDGAATGPWGKTTASVTLGRNGHVKQVTVPAPYDGKAVGDCVVHAFQKIQFPPYGGSVDVVVDCEVELTKPKH